MRPEQRLQMNPGAMFKKEKKTVAEEKAYDALGGI